MTRLIIPLICSALYLVAPSLVQSPAEAQGNSSVESVTGHAEFVTATGIRFRYSVSAIQHKDGRVSGEFQNEVENATTGQFILRAHVGIVCFTVIANTAYIGGIIERQEGLPLPPGSDRQGFITVVDNGEGDEGDELDLASPPGVANGSAFSHCASPLFRPLIPIEHGNIQVRPSGF
jgi:hypothetical protein